MIPSAKLLQLWAILQSYPSSDTVHRYQELRAESAEIAAYFCSIEAAVDARYPVSAWDTEDLSIGRRRVTYASELITAELAARERKEHPPPCTE